MYCTWHSKKNSSLTCTLGFSAALPLGWVSLFAWHVLFVWVGNTGISCLELVPVGKKLWCQVFTQLGNARTTTGTEALTVLYAIIWMAGVAFEGNNVLFIDFIVDLTLRAASNDGATDTSSLNPRLMRTAFFCETSSLSSSWRVLRLDIIFSTFISRGKHFFLQTYCDPLHVGCNSPPKILEIVPLKSHCERPNTAILWLFSSDSAHIKHLIKLASDETAFFGVEVNIIKR